MMRQVRVPALLAPAIPRFFARMNERIERLEAALAAADFATAARIGHNLKGTGGGYGFHGVSESGARMQGLAEAADGGGLAAEIGWLRNYLASVEVVAG